MQQIQIQENKQQLKPTMRDDICKKIPSIEEEIYTNIITSKLPRKLTVKFSDDICQQNGDISDIPTTSQIAKKSILDGLFSSLTFALTLSYPFLNVVILGHLPNSNLYLSGFCGSLVWILLFQWLIFEFNSGFLMLISRSFALRDYKKITIIIRYNITCVSTQNGILVAYGIGLYFLFHFLYSDNSDLLYIMKKSVLIQTALQCLSNYSDSIRNIYLGLQFYKSAWLIQILIFSISLYFGWLFGFYLDLRFDGLLLGFSITQILQSVMYYLYYLYGPVFKLYWKEREKHCVSEFGEESDYDFSESEAITHTNLGNINQGDIEIEDEDEFDKLVDQKFEESRRLRQKSSPMKSYMQKNSSIEYNAERKRTSISPVLKIQSDRYVHTKFGNPMKYQKKYSSKSDQEPISTLGELTHNKNPEFESFSGYMRFNTIFVLMRAQECLWPIIDSQIVLLFFSQEKFSAQISVTSLALFIFAFGIGFGTMINSKVQRYMICDDVLVSKKICWISQVFQLCLGVCLGICIFFPNEILARLLSNDANVQNYIRNLLKIYAFYCPLSLVKEIILVIVRSINQQKIYFLFQIFGNYVVHFVCLWVFVKYGYDFYSVWYAAILGVGVTGVLGIGLIFKTNWQQKAQQMVQLL